MAGEHYKVLVVDDEAAIRDIICETLERKGHQGFQAANGREALEKFSSENFDAAVIDVAMPQMDGITLTREIVKRKPDFPIMIMTGFKDAKINSHPVNEEAISAGAIDFLEKPFAVEAFWLRFYKTMINYKTLFEMRVKQEDLQKISNEMIGDLQKESREKIRALESDLEKMQKKLG